MSKHIPISAMVGKTFGRLKVLRLGEIRKKHQYIVCRCECGIEKEYEASGIRGGRVVSCGCFHKDTLLKHGKSETKEYHAWEAMLVRCYNPQAKNFRLYGARGIRVCERWRESFANFFEDMGTCPPRLTIDRIDNNGDYEPGNCRWASYKTQGRNKRTCRYLTHQGETLALSEWSERTGIPESSIVNRLRRGWSVEKTLTEPIHWNPFKGPKGKSGGFFS